MTGVVAILWIIMCLPIGLFPLLNINQEILFSYSLLAQIITPTVAALCCYITSVVFPKDDAMRRVWSLLGTGVLCWGIGAILFAVYPLMHDGEETPYPWYADVGYLLMVPCVLAAFYVFKKSLHVDSPLWGRISAVFFFLAALALSIAFNLSKFTDSNAVLPYLVTLLYTFGDPLLLGGTIFVASLLAGGAVARPWWLVLIGLILYYAADLSYTYLVVNEQYATGDLIDVGWLLGFGCIAVAALMTRSLFKEF
ncbi:MAG: hypothetical protein H6974_07935 [Gammaproteobacteria bacterium]|nr:hypothetical protein [Gammaproteobacteria bacterium]MCP5196700.1 hypothetical protein [Gammaproteobacteria bacterium]